MMWFLLWLDIFLIQQFYIFGLSNAYWYYKYYSILDEKYFKKHLKENFLYSLLISWIPIVAPILAYYDFEKGKYGFKIY